MVYLVGRNAKSKIVKLTGKAPRLGVQLVMKVVEIPPKLRIKYRMKVGDILIPGLGVILRQAMTVTGREAQIGDQTIMPLRGTALKAKKMAKFSHLAALRETADMQVMEATRRNPQVESQTLATSVRKEAKK